MLAEKLSLPRKVTLFTNLIVAITLLLSGAGFVAIQTHEIRREAREELATIADIVGAMSEAALEFRDEKVARETLQALAPDNRIVAGCIYVFSGKKLAEYRRTGYEDTIIPEAPGPDGHYASSATRIKVFHTVSLHDRQIGIIYLEADVRSVMVEHLRRILLISVLVLAGALVVGLFLSRRLQRLVTAPISRLTNTVRELAERKDYSLRATKDADDEVGFLVDQFNQLVSQVQSAEQYQKLLLAELSHRVKNTLATVHSLASHTAEGSTSIEEFIKSFDGRLLSLARTHSLLTASEWRGASLSGLAEQAMQPYKNDSSENIVVSGPDVYLAPKASVSVSMILHELCTNAAKYGAFSTPTGMVKLAWAVQNGDGRKRVHLTWEESGGPQVLPPERKGFGTTLVELAAEYELQGEAKLRFNPTGVSYELEFPNEHSKQHA